MGAQYFNASIETMSPEERTAFQLKALRDLLKYTYARCSGVKEKFDAAGIRPADIRMLEGLQRVPLTTKDELRRLQEKNPPFGGFLSIPMQDVETIYCSPGPIFEPQDPSDAFWARLLKCLHATGVGRGDIITCTLSYHLVPAGLWLHTAARRLGATAVPAGPGNTELQVRILHDLGVTAYIGTPSFLYTLITKAQEMGYDFHKQFRLRKALTTAEMLSPSMRATLESYGVDIIQSYGTADVGLFAYECRHKNGFHMCEETIIEILDPVTKTRLGPGEVGEIVVTTLDVRVYPWIRFATGDLSLYTEEPCPCGRTSNRLVKIVGRVGEAAKIRGMFVHPKQVDEVMSRFPIISRWTVLVTRPGQRDELTLKVELDQGAGDVAQIREGILSKFPELCHLRPDSVEFVPLGSIPDDQVKKVVDKRVWK
ncbi:MAG: AMP-binding protein [Chloroflexota bacterium]